MMHSCSERRMILWSLCFIFCFSNTILVIASPTKHLCLPDQRDALWEFKNEFSVQKPDWMKSDTRTEKWRNNTDCCSWDGVSCDSMGNVIRLDVWKSYFNGPLRSNSSLFRLQHLLNLDLGDNNLSGILPDSIGNLKYLTDLILHSCNLHGKIPSSLGNLSYLTYLDLSNNDFTSGRPDSMGNLNRLSNLQLVLLNLTSLTGIDLSSNQFEGTLPSNMSSLSKLKYFDISGNSFSGSIPSSLFMITSLVELHLGRNNFSGPLEITENNFNGPNNAGRGIVDVSIFLHLKSLELLDLSYLNTKSMVDLSLFSHLMSLSDLNLSGISLKISSTLHFPSPMVNLILSSCNISEFPKFLQNQTHLNYLDISANQIEGQVPQWFWRRPDLQYVNISQNYFSGELTMLPNSIRHFSGSDNRFFGEIPRAISESVSLETLVLSNNNFSGSIPRCFENYNTTLFVLHLQNNSLSGVFPEESVSVDMISLDVGHNRLSGKLPKSLINCTSLQFLNVEDNRINDTFPFWLRSLSNLQILVLRSNEFHGPISSPGDSLSFPKLRIFDISENRFNGVLPSYYFAGWSATSSVVVIEDYTPLVRARVGVAEDYHYSVALTNKGLKMELIGSGFTIYKTIDVSGNRLEGEIPESIGLLKELIVLNMSNNVFTGRIPPSMSNLTNLESLDLSQNRLYGKIPPELGKLTFLARMNFSYNNLEGPIPQGTQIQSQNSSSFIENPGLCGAPLPKTCGGEVESTNQEQDGGEEREEKVLSWIAAAIAYIPGVFCGLIIAHILTS